MGRLSKRSDGSRKLAGVFYGRQVWATIDAWLKVQASQHIQEVDYELRVLSIPGLGLDAFWLAARTKGKEDLVVPLRPDGAPAPSGSEQIQTAAHFLATIRPQALAQLGAA